MIEYLNEYDVLEFPPNFFVSVKEKEQTFDKNKAYSKNNCINFTIYINISNNLVINSKAVAVSVLLYGCTTWTLNKMPGEQVSWELYKTAPPIS